MCWLKARIREKVMVACETYKFCERVQTDAFVYNELGISILVYIHMSGFASSVCFYE